MKGHIDNIDVIFTKRIEEVIECMELAILNEFLLRPADETKVQRDKETLKRAALGKEQPSFICPAQSLKQVLKQLLVNTKQTFKDPQADHGFRKISL